MSRSAWRIAADTRAYPADEMTGAGAERIGGRWNEVGVPMIYAAGTRALACLETVVHLVGQLPPLNRYLVEIAIPDDLWAAAEIADSASLIGWDAEPASITSVAFGTDWAESGRSALLLVPSVIVPEEHNVVINPAHPDAVRLGARKVRRWLYDPRLRQA